MLERDDRIKLANHDPTQLTKYLKIGKECKYIRAYRVGGYMTPWQSLFYTWYMVKCESLAGLEKMVKKAWACEFHYHAFQDKTQPCGI